MKIVSRSFSLAVLFAVTTLGPVSLIAQQTQKPFETKLLNGLKVVVLKTSEETVSVRLRIHAGSTFDMAGKEGTIRLLTEILFPSDELRSFIEEDFGKELRLITTYDFIEIQTGAKREKLISLLETLATRVANPEINSETTEAAKKLLLAATDTGLERSLNQETASLHLGTYPHGRPIDGTSESRARIDFADIVQARSRFLSPDNATLIISGDIDEGLMSRATRRLFGPWNRADQRPRWSFAAPQKSELKENSFRRDGIPEGIQEHRLAVRNFSRSDARFPSYQVLITILNSRLKSKFESSTLEDRGHRVQGVLILGGATGKLDAGDFLSNNLFAEVSETEFTDARRLVMSSQKSIIDRYLDSDSYGFPSIDFETDAISKVTLDDVNATLRILRESPRTQISFTSAMKVEKSR